MTQLERAAAPALVRAVLTATDAGGGVLFSPLIDPVEVPLGDGWGSLLATRQRVPVACDAGDPRVYWLIDRQHGDAPGGVTIPRGVRAPLLGPSSIELQVPAPSVGEYLRLVTDGAPSRLAEVPTAPLLQAMALRIEQLSLHEHERIARLARSWVDPDLLGRITAVGAGMDYSAWQLEAALRRLPRGGDRWPLAVLEASYVAVMRAGDADAEMPADTPAVFRRLVRAADRGVSRRDVGALLRPFVTVCGPIPTLDVEPLRDPDEPYAARGGPLAASPAAAAAPQSVPGGRAAHGERTRPASPETPANPAAPKRESGRWWRRKASAASDRLSWQAAIERHNAVLEAYLAYETDPQLILEYPAILDVTVPQTQAFHQAGALASALRTDDGPHDSAHARDFLEATTALQAAWDVAERHARRSGRGYLGAEDARAFGRAAGLLRHAQGASGAEADSYLRAAVDLLREHVAPRVTGKAVASLERVVRGELEA